LHWSHLCLLTVTIHSLSVSRIMTQVPPSQPAPKEKKGLTKKQNKIIMQRIGKVCTFNFRSVTRLFLSPGQGYSGTHTGSMVLARLKTNTTLTKRSKNLCLRQALEVTRRAPHYWPWQDICQEILLSHRMETESLFPNALPPPSC
jgi:hypothetical protein